jgi:hypothetical protein
MTKRRLYAGIFALLVGCLVNYIGDKVIGVRLELFWGLGTFNFLWFLQLFIWCLVWAANGYVIFPLPSSGLSHIWK